MTTTEIRRHATGRRHNPGEVFDLPIPSPEAEAMLPAAVRDARDKLLELNVSDNLAQGAIYTTHEAIVAAEEADAVALGEAITAGKADPGPVNVTAARQAHADAQRVAAGTAKALGTARHAFHAALVETDCTETVAALEVAAAAELVKAEDALSVLRQAFMAYRGLRTLANTLALYPEVPVGFEVDAQDYTRSLSTIRDTFTAMEPGYDVPHVRGVPKGEGDFTDAAYTPPNTDKKHPYEAFGEQLLKGSPRPLGTAFAPGWTPPPAA